MEKHIAKERVFTNPASVRWEKEIRDDAARRFDDTPIWVQVLIRSGCSGRTYYRRQLAVFIQDQAVLAHIGRRGRVYWQATQLTNQHGDVLIRLDEEQ